jgi:hypothetical protein
VAACARASRGRDIQSEREAHRYFFQCPVNVEAGTAGSHGTARHREKRSCAEQAQKQTTHIH